MGPLGYPRHERFAQNLFEGMPASTAYQEAGYVPNDGNAIRLKGNERVQARLRELQEAVAKKTEVTVESLLAELEHARQRGRRSRSTLSGGESPSAKRRRLAAFKQPK